MDKITYIAVLLTYIVFVDIGAKGYVFYKTMEAREEVRTALYEQCLKKYRPDSPIAVSLCRQEANKKLKEME